MLHLGGRGNQLSSRMDPFSEHFRGRRFVVGGTLFCFGVSATLFYNPNEYPHRNGLVIRAALIQFPHLCFH